MARNGSKLDWGYIQDHLQPLLDLKETPHSAGELKTQTYIGMDIGYIDKEIGMKWIQETDEIGKMLAGLIKLKRNQTNLKP